MQTVIETRKLGKSYGMKFALQNADLSVYEGEVCGIVGRNGAGKTTLLKLIAGLTEPSTGSISLFNSTDLRLQRQRVGSLIEQPALMPYLTVEQNLHYFRKLKGITEKESVLDVMMLTGIHAERKTSYQTLSMGMKQRLSVALALLGEPDLLLLDEPTNGIDHQSLAHLRDLLTKLSREKRVTILISSHLLTELTQIATRFVILDRGIVIEQINKSELDRQSRTAIRIETDQPSRVAVLLEQKFGFTEYTIDGDLGVLLYEGFDLIPAITNALVLAGISIWGIHKQRADLETYFMQKIGDLND